MNCPLALSAATAVVVACGSPPAAPPVRVDHHAEEPVAAHPTDTELTIAERWVGLIAADEDAGAHVVIVRDDAAYDQLIANLPERRVQMKQPAPPSDDPLRARPAIDFATDMLVVAIRPGTLRRPTIARVEQSGDRIVVRVASPPLRPEARPHGIGAYAAARVPRADGTAELASPRVITSADDVPGAVGQLVTLVGPLSRTRIPTILGVDVDEGDATAGQPALATGWLGARTVTQAEIDERIARSGQYAHRGPGTFYRLAAPEGGRLASATPP